MLHKYNSLKYRTSKLLGTLAVEAPSRFSVPPVRGGVELTDRSGSSLGTGKSALWLPA